MAVKKSRKIFNWIYGFKSFGLGLNFAARVPIFSSPVFIQPILAYVRNIIM